MIVPRMRLILLAAATLPAAGFWMAWRPDGVAYVVAGIIVLAAVAGLDSIWRRSQLNAMTVTVPEVVRMTVDKVSSIRIVLGKPEAMSNRLRFGLALPSAVASEQQDLCTELEKGFEEATFDWHCRPSFRGQYFARRCYLEVDSRLGLWSLRRRFAVRSQIRVYPNLMTGQQQLIGLFLRRQWGVRTRRRVGKGREFEQLRDYLPGDSFEDIDWKATARRRHLISRVYQVEQAQEIYVVLDASRLSTRNATYIMDRRSSVRSASDTPTTTIFERFVTAALVMAVVSERLSDRYGLLVFGDTLKCFIKAGSGSAHYNACREALYHRMPQTVSPDFDELFTFLGTHVRKRALLVFLTSLDDPVVAESFTRAMPVASRQHIMMVNMFRPPGAFPLFSSPDVKKIQGIYQHLVGHMLWSSMNETQRRFKKMGVSLHLLDEHQLCSQLVNQYMDIKQQQII